MTADGTAWEDARAVTDRIVPAAALMRATAPAARNVPELNGFRVDDGFVPGEGVHLGVAVTVRHGALVAPALHDAADLALPDLMRALRDLVRRARSGRLTRAELTEPTLTVTDLVVRAIRRIVPDADFDELRPDADLRRTFELDSLDFLSFVELLAAGAGIRIDEVDYPELATMRSCQRLLSARSAARPAG